MAERLSIAELEAQCAVYEESLKSHGGIGAVAKANLGLPARG
jgi:hypothetical protein